MFSRSERQSVTAALGKGTFVVFTQRTRRVTSVLLVLLTVTRYRDCTSVERRVKPHWQERRKAVWFSRTRARYLFCLHKAPYRRVNSRLSRFRRNVAVARPDHETGGRGGGGENRLRTFRARPVRTTVTKDVSERTGLSPKNFKN